MRLYVIDLYDGFLDQPSGTDRRNHVRGDRTITAPQESNESRDNVERHDRMETEILSNPSLGWN
jgi:hypothetical protein